MSTFDKAKIGDKVVDSGYGPGKVVGKTARRLHVDMAFNDEVWKYDKAHADQFLKIEKRKGSK